MPRGTLHKKDAGPIIKIFQQKKLDYTNFYHHTQKMDYKNSIDKALKHFHLEDLIKFKASFKLPNHEVKKNRRKIMTNFKTNKPFIGKSKILLDAELVMINNLKLERMRQKSQTIGGDLWMIAIFETDRKVLLRKDGVRKKTSANLSNLYQLVEDCLQVPKITKTGKRTSNGSGAIIDDDQIRAHDWSRIVAGDTTQLHLYLIDYEEAQKRLGLA